jgi:hypothetical protein
MSAHQCQSPRSAISRHFPRFRYGPFLFGKNARWSLRFSLVVIWFVYFETFQCLQSTIHAIITHVHDMHDVSEAPAVTKRAVNRLQQGLKIRICTEKLKSALTDMPPFWSNCNCSGSVQYSKKSLEYMILVWLCESVNMVNSSRQLTCLLVWHCLWS